LSLFQVRSEIAVREAEIEFPEVGGEDEEDKEDKLEKVDKIKKEEEKPVKKGKEGSTQMTVQFRMFWKIR
jgi:hypothetical protein